KLHMNKTAFACLGMLTLLMACGQNEKETPSGLKYTVLKTGDGETPKTGEIIVFDWQLKDSKDSVWQGTFQQGIPAAAQIATEDRIQEEDGLTQMLRFLSRGDSVRADMPITEYFSRGPGMVPPELDSTLTLSFTIKVRNILPEAEFESYMQNELAKREGRVFDQDTKAIGEYLSSNNL